jgi:hypothetical protein
LVRKILKSTRNVFGLFRQYYAARFLYHDPDAYITPGDLNEAPDLCSTPLDHDPVSPGESNTSTGFSSTPPVHSYGPYPNLSSILLGEWYWNDGERKSQSSFQKLLKIVGHPDFRPEEVAGKNWQLIDSRLGGGSNIEDDWEDDGGWIKTPIKINVPFSKKMLHPGQKEFDAGAPHHRKLMSVIRERITRPSIHPHLHFEPYKLFWQPNDVTEPVRVHGKLYTSDAFIEAHNKLQDSPPEPGCDFPKIAFYSLTAPSRMWKRKFET